MNNLKGKKVAVLGLGVENLPLVRFLVKKGAEVTVCDRSQKSEVRNQKAEVKEWRLGKDYLKNLTDFELVFRTPGLPRFTPELIEAEIKGVEISSATKLFFDLCPAKIIGITGTKGKGTCASLIEAMLKLKNKIWLGGNIGKPAISILPKIKPEDWVILELSSFQLQDLQKGPHIAVILNITSDHLDYHKTQKEYLRAKENIVRYQTKKDFAVINADYLTSFKFAVLTKGKVYWFSKRKSVDEGCFIKKGEIILRIDGKEIKICDISQIKLPGLHNLENTCAAIIASHCAGAKIADIQKVITTFKGLEHRLELVAETRGIKYINDSFSTTPETTIAAIKSFSQPIVLICGGRSKGGDYGKLAKAILKSPVKNLILIGEMADEIEKKLKVKNEKLKIIVKNLKFSKMDKIVKTAQKEAKPGDVVLFSPGAASFDMFKNATERGKQFKQAVLKIIHEYTL